MTKAWLDRARERREERWMRAFLAAGGRGTFVAPIAELPEGFVLPSLAPIPENPAVTMEPY